MKRTVSILAVLLLARPAWAAVTITLTKITYNKIAIGYDARSEPQLVRAFALDVTAAGGNIIDINDYAIGDDNHGYGVFPANFSRYITVNPTTGMVDSWDAPAYTPVAPPDTPGALGGLGTDGITIEMGSLYDTNVPAVTGVLCTVTVSEGTCRLCVNGNEIRGNIVMEDGSERVPVEACYGYVVTDCFPSTFTTYADWVTYDKPDCWCNSAAFTCGGTQSQLGDYQCDGDCDGKPEGAIGIRVFSKDLLCMIEQWKKRIHEVTNPCADFDHKAEGPLKYRVFSRDLGILVANWKKKDAQLPGNCPRPE